MVITRNSEPAVPSPPLDAEALVWSQADDVARLSRQLCGHREDAEDVAQTSLLKAAQHLSGFRGESSVRTWLHRITANECRMLRRKVLARSLDQMLERSVTELPSPEPSPDEVAEDRVMVRALLRVISHLPDRQRTALVLQEGAGLPVAEVAARMELSVAAVRSLLVRARRAVRQEMLGDL